MVARFVCFIIVLLVLFSCCCDSLLLSVAWFKLFVYCCLCLDICCVLIVCLPASVGWFDGVCDWYCVVCLLLCDKVLCWLFACVIVAWCLVVV